MHHTVMSRASVAAPERPHSPISVPGALNGDISEQSLEIELSRLDALDHADALSKWGEVSVPHGNYAESHRLETVFEAAARLLAREDHGQQMLSLEVSRRTVRILVAAHHARADTASDEQLASLYLDHASQLQRQLGGVPSTGETHTYADS